MNVVYYFLFEMLVYFMWAYSAGNGKELSLSVFCITSSSTGLFSSLYFQGEYWQGMHYIVSGDPGCSQFMSPCCLFHKQRNRQRRSCFLEVALAVHLFMGILNSIKLQPLILFTLEYIRTGMSI